MLNLSADDALAVMVVQTIQVGDVNGLGKLLAGNPALAQARIVDRGGVARALLHVVADWPGHFPNGPQTVATLIGAGAEVNATVLHTNAPETALHWAASNDDVGVLDALLDGGGRHRGPRRGFYGWHTYVRRGRLWPVAGRPPLVCARGHDKPLAGCRLGPVACRPSRGHPAAAAHTSADHKRLLAWLSRGTTCGGRLPLPTGGEFELDWLRPQGTARCRPGQWGRGVGAMANRPRRTAGRELIAKPLLLLVSNLVPSQSRHR